MTDIVFWLKMRKNSYGYKYGHVIYKMKGNGIQNVNKGTLYHLLRKYLNKSTLNSKNLPFIVIKEHVSMTTDKLAQSDTFLIIN